MSETDADFLGRYWEQLNWDTDDADFDRLFELARRGAEATARIGQLEAALEWIDQQRYTGRCTINPANGYARAVALNEQLLALMDVARAAMEDK